MKSCAPAQKRMINITVLGLMSKMEKLGVFDGELLPARAFPGQNNFSAGEVRAQWDRWICLSSRTFDRLAAQLNRYRQLEAWRQLEINCIFRSPILLRIVPKTKKLHSIDHMLISLLGQFLD